MAKACATQPIDTTAMASATTTKACASQVLSDLQRKCIPSLMGVGRIPALHSAFIAMQLVRGTALSAMRCIPDGVAVAAQRALAQLHAHGVAHGDVRLEVRFWGCEGSRTMGRARPGTTNLVRPCACVQYRVIPCARTARQLAPVVVVHCAVLHPRGGVQCFNN